MIDEISKGGPLEEQADKNSLNLLETSNKNILTKMKEI